MISLGVDIGGTGCKCVAFREDGTQLALSYREYPTQPGQVNLDPLLLRESVFWVIGSCVRQLPQPDRVAAITVSSFGESFVPLSDQGTPLTDILLYFANSESADFDRLVGQVGAQRFMDIACVLPDASYSLSKMLHTIKTVPQPVWKFLFVASYLCFCLSGSTLVDYALASRSLLFDVRSLCWSKPLLAASGIEESQLPTVVPAGTVAGCLLPAVAQELGLPPGVQVVVGTHDQIVNALGAGVHQWGEAVNITGTVECIEPLFPAIPETLDFQRNNYACVPYLGGRGYVTYAYNISGGAVVKWYRDTLAAHLGQESAARGCSIYDLLNETCPQAPTDLLVLPHLQGMGGTPDVQTAATGLIQGLTMHTTLPQLYRGVLEGLCLEMAYNLRRLEQFSIAPTRLYACGGGARSAPWLQIKADCLGCEIIPSQIPETGAMGSAVLGLAAVTGERDVFRLARQFLRHGPPVHPNPVNTELYAEKFCRYTQLRQMSLDLAAASKPAACEVLV